MENFNNQQFPQYSGENQPYQQAYPPPLPPAMSEEKRFKKWMYKIFGGNLLYEGIMFGTIFAVAVVIGVALGVLMVFSDSSDVFDTFLENFENTDMGSTFAVLIATFFLGLFMRKVIKPKEIFEKKKSMNPKSFLMIFCVFYGCQLVFSLLGIGLEMLLNLVGLTAEEAVEATVEAPAEEATEEAASGEEVADTDTGCQWYTAENIDDPEIAQNLYD